MRHLFILTALIMTVLTPANAAVSPKDNLLTVLERANDPEEKVRIYRNLADLSTEPTEACDYLLKLTEAAKTTGQIRQMMEALTDLTITYIQCDKLDSARYTVALVEKHAPKPQHDQWVCYLKMRLYSADLMSESAEDAVDQKIADFKNRDMASESIYEQIETEFCLGATLDKKNEKEEALEHMNKALELSKKPSFRDGGPYQLLIMRNLSRLHNSMRNTSKASEITQKAIEVKEQYHNQFEKNRPYYPMDDFYIANYAAILINIKNMPDQEINDYLDRLIEMSDRSNKPAHKYSRFLAQYNYSVFKQKYRQALIYNDSVIRYAKQIAVYNLPRLYQLNTVLYKELGDYKSALDNLHQAYQLQDSIRQGDAREKFDKLRVEYDVNRLNYENSQLEIRNKHILLISLSIVLISMLVLCFYLYSHLKREQTMKKRMESLKMQAEESEKLKTAFINSICHEIRTPLNGIVGYTHLMLDPSVDEEDRNSCPAVIQENTDQLVALIDSMLEVANLDVSDEKLPCNAVNITALCRMISARYAAQNLSDKITGITHCPNEQLVAQTHERYLAMVIENLLNNAYKFTVQGQITLECSQQQDQVVITVTDTGCGIAPENYERVFDRFIKLDTYTTGSGLGLYLCKIIVRRLSGTIQIDPNYTCGTRMVVTLPLN